MASSDLLKAVAVTAELCGRTFTPEAAAVFVSDLAGLPEPAVMVALKRCRKEIRGVMTLQDVISRIDDGRPGPEEAWAMIPKNEAATVVWTAEMCQAHAVACPLLDSGDAIGARMAFKETYSRLVSAARDEQRPVSWSASLGHDAGLRDRALALGVEQGRISVEYARSESPLLQIADDRITDAASGLLRRIA